ncbi:unnamed protein product [Rotaria magnacalcarata]
MSRWAVEMQDSGITDTMKINILSALRTAIETHGSSNMYEVCKSVSNWLDETYGKVWCVIIGETGKAAWFGLYYQDKYLLVKDTTLNWTIRIFEQTP